MAVLCAREVRPDEIFGVGIQSTIATVGAVLAKNLHAPTARLVTRGLAGGELVAGAREPHALAMSGKMGLFFLTPAQVDGNLDVNFERLRKGDDWQTLSGAFAVPVYYSVVRRVVLLVPRHNPESLPAKVDYITASGSPAPRERRLGGPYRIITDKAVLGVDRERGGVTLLSYHPGESVESVRAATGFELHVADDVGETLLPTAEEKEVLASRVFPGFAPGSIPWLGERKSLS
ncbi:hypothetical protein [Bosea massiliensis]|uniref:CoA synthetase n=1 Tax=Bosea massiliensis TaxID=151419 RepID=A0ABW0P8B4_9HYPH